jgi:hypothetical protein
MPRAEDRLAHLRKLLETVVAGREQKIMLLEVANEGWQNGFRGAEGVAQLREFAEYLSCRTEVPIAITSNHDWPAPGRAECFELVYANSAADIATWHFSRDRRSEEGWRPVYDCWELAGRAGFPPVSSNEPIGPGASVDSEVDPVRLTLAACCAYAASAPMYVFHSEAGVFGKTPFAETPGITSMQHAVGLLPGDLARWERNDGREAGAPFTAFAGGRANCYWPDVADAADGCVRNYGSRRRGRFVCLPVGIRPGGLQLEAREAVEYAVHDPVTGECVQSGRLAIGGRLQLPPGRGGWIVLGSTADGTNQKPGP